MNQYDDLGLFALCNARLTTPGKRFRPAPRRAAADLCWVGAVLLVLLFLAGVAAGCISWLIFG